MSDQEKDPVVHSSLSKPLFISSALLVLSMVWGLYDEAYGIRPWKGYQARFVKLYSRYLRTAAGGEADVERQIKTSPDYKRLDAEMQAAEKHDVSLPGEDQKRSMDFKAMSDQLQAWKDEKAKLLQQRVDLMKEATAL